MTQSVYDKKRKGYITLMTVLVVSAVGLALGVSLLYLGSASITTTLSSQQSSHARAYANACAEKALSLISGNATFSGSGSLSFSNGSCTYEVIHASQNETINAVGIEGTIVRKVQVTLNTDGFRWQEIP